MKYLLKVQVLGHLAFLLVLGFGLAA